LKKHVVIYSHGFGVQKDDRGLLTDIAAAMPSIEHVLFDYNSVDEASKTLKVSPLQDQVEKLKSIIVGIRSENPNADIDIVGHSQGCMVAAIAHPLNIRKAIFLAPPSKLHADRLIKLFSERPGTEINIDGVSRLARRDGSTTIVPAAYWHTINRYKPIQLYKQFSEVTKVTILAAEQDEILGNVSFDGVDNDLEIISISGANHDFTGNARPVVIEAVKKLIIGEVSSK
jgi:pimeloyl-ACP methyl ester carboxylesterase